MFCKNCGFENQADALCCINCGSGTEDGKNNNQNYDDTQFQPDMGQQNIIGTENAVSSSNNSTFGILGIVFGSVGIALATGGCCCLPFLGTWTLIIALASFSLAVAGIILGAIGMKKAEETGVKDTLSVVGLILSIVALVVSLVSGIVLILMVLVMFGVISLPFLASFIDTYII